MYICAIKNNSMRKLHILKAIVDFIWIVSMLFIPFIIIAIPLLFIKNEVLEFTAKISGVALELTTINILVKVLVAISTISFLLILYSIYLFRKILTYFLRLKIFDDFVILYFKRIGNLLVLSGFLSILVSFIFRLYYQQKISIEISINSHVVIICLGLFFMVLSEIFKISKTMKDENDLTV